MAEHKTRFTVWMDPEILRAAKARALQEGLTVSEVLAAAAKRSLIDSDRPNTDAQVLQAVERVFNLIQRIDRRHVYDQQVLKEMLGLMVRSFFNHTPAVPKKDWEAAVISGKARFNRFLDILANNLRSGKSVLNDMPAQEPAQKLETVAAQPADSALHVATPRSEPSMSSPIPVSSTESVPPTIEPTIKTVSANGIAAEAPETVKSKTTPLPAEKPKPAPARKPWNLFG